MEQRSCYYILQITSHIDIQKREYLFMREPNDPQVLSVYQHVNVYLLLFKSEISEYVIVAVTPVHLV